MSYDENKKRAQLLHFAGFNVQDICISRIDSKVWLSFSSHRRHTYKQHMFCNIAMTGGETADQCMTCLRKQAEQYDNLRWPEERLFSPFRKINFLWKTFCVLFVSRKRIFTISKNISFSPEGEYFLLPKGLYFCSFWL